MAQRSNINNMCDFFILVILLVVGSKIIEGCEEGWELHSEKCYLFSMKFYGWEDAKTYCEYVGGNLVKIDNDEEHKFIRDRVSAMELHYVWIGAKWSRARRKHLWIDGSEITFNGWAPGEPGDRRGCVDYLHKYNYLWDSHCDCMYTRGPFICEKEINDKSHFRHGNSSSSGDCGEGWKMEGNKCVLVPETSSNVAEAKTYCEDHGAVLTTGDKEKAEGSEETFRCEKECELGWEKFGMNCYLHVDKQRSWEDAKSYCEEAGSSLVKVEGDEEHRYIQKKISDARHVYVWIGARYDPEHGEHRWIDGSPMNFSSWAPGLPGKFQGCVDYLHKYNYDWNTHSDCKFTPGPFICEKAPKGHDDSVVDKEDTTPTRIETEEQLPAPVPIPVNLDKLFQGSNFCGIETTTVVTESSTETEEPHITFPVPKLTTTEEKALTFQMIVVNPSIDRPGFVTTDDKVTDVTEKALTFQPIVVIPTIDRPGFDTTDDTVTDVTEKALTFQPIVVIPTIDRPGFDTTDDTVTDVTEGTDEDPKIGRIVSDPDEPRYVCYPNNTILVHDIPANSYYLAMQNITSGGSKKCTVTRQGTTTTVKITGCLKDDPIIFTYGSFSGMDTHQVHVGQSVNIRCYEISEDGVPFAINNTFAADLQIDSTNVIDPSYNVTSSLNTTSTNVGDPVAWTISFPAEYILEVTSCTAEPDTTDSTDLSVQLISEGGCMVNSELISNFEDNLDGTAVATLTSFKFYSYDDILLTCDVIVCPATSSACNTTCSRQKRDIPNRSNREADVISTYVQSRLHVIDHTSSGPISGPQLAVTAIFQLAVAVLVIL